MILFCLFIYCLFLEPKLQPQISILTNLIGFNLMFSCVFLIGSNINYNIYRMIMFIEIKTYYTKAVYST